jgi:hypothetical protein
MHRCHYLLFPGLFQFRLDALLLMHFDSSVSKWTDLDESIRLVLSALDEEYGSAREIKCRYSNTGAAPWSSGSGWLRNLLTTFSLFPYLSNCSLAQTSHCDGPLSHTTAATVSNIPVVLHNFLSLPVRPLEGPFSLADMMKV